MQDTPEFFWGGRIRLEGWGWNHISHALKCRYPVVFECDTTARDWLYDGSLKQDGKQLANLPKLMSSLWIYPERVLVGPAPNHPFGQKLSKHCSFDVGCYSPVPVWI